LIFKFLSRAVMYASFFVFCIPQLGLLVKLESHELVHEYAYQCSRMGGWPVNRDLEVLFVKVTNGARRHFASARPVPLPPPPHHPPSPPPTPLILSLLLSLFLYALILHPPIAQYFVREFSPPRQKEKSKSNGSQRRATADECP